MLAILALTALGVGGSWSNPQDPTRVQKQNEHDEIVDAIRKGGLREAARIKGNYSFTSTAYTEAEFADVEALTSHSELVIIGTPVIGAARLSPNGNAIVTDYQVNIIATLKPNKSEEHVLTIIVPGGIVRFEDGTSAEMRTPGLKIENGKTHIFFVTARDPISGKFHLTGGPQGVYEIPADNSGVIPQGREIDHIFRRYKGQQPDSFLQEIKQAAKKWPGTVKCC